VHDDNERAKISFTQAACRWIAGVGCVAMMYPSTATFDWRPGNVLRALTPAILFNVQPIEESARAHDFHVGEGRDILWLPIPGDEVVRPGGNRIRHN
jgi:hypothetical protein